MTVNYFKGKSGYEINGIWYPRVTSICSIIAKPGLEIWLANQRSYAAMQAKRKKIVGWGRLVHEIIEQILLGRMPRVNPDVRPSIDAFLDWFKKHKVDIFGIEKRVTSNKHLYSGTLDVLSKIDGKFGILDLKTSKEIWDDYFIQIAAYFQAFNERAEEKAKTYWILRIDQYQECRLCGARKREKGGEPDIKRNNKNCNHRWTKPKGICEFKEVNNHQLYINTFLSAKKLWEFANRQWLAQIENYAGNEIVKA